MTIGLRGVTTAVASTNITSYDVNLPTGCQPGEFAVLAADTASGAATFTGPSGWTVAVTPTDLSSIKVGIWIQVLTAADIAAGLVTLTRSVAGTFSGCMAVFTGTSAIDVLSASGTGTATTTATVPGLTPVLPDALRLAIGWARPTATGVTATHTVPGGWTGLAEASDAGTGNRRVVWVDSQQLSGQGGVAQGASAVTYSQTGNWAAYSLTLAPAGAPLSSGPARRSAQVTGRRASVVTDPPADPPTAPPRVLSSRDRFPIQARSRRIATPTPVVVTATAPAIVTSRTTRRRVPTIPARRGRVTAGWLLPYYPRFDGSNDFQSAGRTAFDATTNPSGETIAAAYTGRGLEMVTVNGVVVNRWTSGTFNPNHAYGSVSFKFRFRALPLVGDLGGTSASVMGTKSSTPVGGTGQGHYGMFFDPADGRLHWDLLAANFGISTMPIQAGMWYFVQTTWFYGGTTYTADVQINGITQTSIASPGLIPYAVKSIGFGTDSAVQTYTVDIDDVQFAASTTAIGFLGPATYISPAPAPPVRRRLPRSRRGQARSPVPAQQTVVAPPYPVRALSGRRRFLSPARRGRDVSPVPQQQTPLPSNRPPQFARARPRLVALARRARLTVGYLIGISEPAPEAPAPVSAPGLGIESPSAASGSGTAPTATGGD